MKTLTAHTSNLMLAPSGESLSLFSAMSLLICSLWFFAAILLIHGVCAVKFIIKSKRMIDAIKSLHAEIESSMPGNVPCDYHLFLDRNGKVTVEAAYSSENGSSTYVTIKEINYNPNDAEDKAFALREAEELIEKLEENK